MAAPKDNKNAVGNTGGKSLNDRKLAASVRSLALTEIEKYLRGKEEGYQDKEMKSALLLKLAPSLLPRLNEHTGEDGKDLIMDDETRALAKKAINEYITRKDTGAGGEE